MSHQPLVILSRLSSRSIFIASCHISQLGYSSWWHSTQPQEERELLSTLSSLICSPAVTIIFLQSWLHKFAWFNAPARPIPHVSCALWNRPCHKHSPLKTGPLLNLTAPHFSTLSWSATGSQQHLHTDACVLRHVPHFLTSCLGPQVARYLEGSLPGPLSAFPSASLISLSWMLAYSDGIVYTSMNRWEGWGAPSLCWWPGK